MNKNPFYAAPEAELLVVRFEENLLGSGDDPIKPWTPDDDPLE